jgi:hypothetical protein
MRRAHFRRCLVLALVATAAAGCGGSSAGPTSTTKTPPNLAAFLHLPIASPSSCPSSESGSTSGRRSPWVGHVDVSVFVADNVDRATGRALHGALVAAPHVGHVYSETKREAYAEFQRLYTCSAAVPRSSAPASYRLVLDQVTVAQRDALVRQIYRLPGVGSVSCDPSSPCVDVRRGG